MRHVKRADSAVVRGEESLESSWRGILGIDGLSDRPPRSHNVSTFSGRCWETLGDAGTQLCGGRRPQNLWLCSVFRQRSGCKRLIFKAPFVSCYFNQQKTTIIPQVLATFQSLMGVVVVAFYPRKNRKIVNFYCLVL